MKASKKWLIPLFIILIIGIVVLVVLLRKQDKWQPVRQAPVVSAIYGLGTVQANKEFNLAAGYTSYIQKFYVDLGDPVQAGQMLVRFRDGQLIKAPFAGIVTAKLSNVDEIISPQTSVLTVTDLNNLYLLVNLDQDSLLKLKTVKNVKINFEALPNQVFTGKVAAIYSHDNNFYVRVIPNHLPKNILPGMTADVALVTSTTQQSILIPLTSLRDDHVTYRSNQTEQTVKVKIGVQQDGWGQVLSQNIPANAQVRVH